MMRRISGVLVAVATAVAVAAPTGAFAQLERRSGSSPGSSSGSAGGYGGGVVVEESDDRGGRDDRGRGNRVDRDERGRGGRDDSPRGGLEQPRFKGGPEPAPPPSGVTRPREEPPSAVTRPAPRFKGGPEPLPPGQRPPQPAPPPRYGGPPPQPPPSRGGWLRRMPMPPDTPRRPPDIRPGWPLRRAPFPVIVRRRHDYDEWRIVPRIFLPPILFGAVIVDNYGYRRYYERGRLSWADSEWIYRDEGWVEFVFDVRAWGDMLWLEVRDGRAAVDWAEIVFADGESQVVDFEGRLLGPGLYRLLDYRGERRVDHVRMVAMADTRDVQLILRMER